MNLRFYDNRYIGKCKFYIKISAASCMLKLFKVIFYLKFLSNYIELPLPI